MTTDNYTKAIVSIVDDILGRRVDRFPMPTFICPECGMTSTDPDEYAYGHDCE